MRLSHTVLEAVDKSKVVVYHANRSRTAFFNERLQAGEPRYFGGWYWHPPKSNVAHGPFSSKSAAIRDAYANHVQQNRASLPPPEPEEHVSIIGGKAKPKPSSQQEAAAESQWSRFGIVRPASYTSKRKTKKA